MAGQPRKRAMILELERRAKAFDESTVLEYATDWVGGGKTLLDLTADINKSLKLGDTYVSRNMVSSYLNGLEGGLKALADARLEAGHSLADDSLRIVDEPVESKEEVAANKLRAEQRTKLAGFWNRGVYGQQQQGISVQFNLGESHLDALRLRNVTAKTTPALPPPASEGDDVELVVDQPGNEG
jgi:hypothetical protein